MEIIQEKINCNQINYVTEEDVKNILSKLMNNYEDSSIENYVVYNASDKMLGFLSDYWKLKVNLKNKCNTMEVLSFFIKAVSRTNAAKAAMVKDLHLYDKEVNFYTILKNKIEVTVLKPWSPKLVTLINDAMVFEDLNAMQYRVRDKFLRFDSKHINQALETLARFHAVSIIFEENMTKKLHKTYRINDEYKKYLDDGGYVISDPWYEQCMNGALEAIKSYSKHSKNKGNLEKIRNKWRKVWTEALDDSPEERNVICHRDLWNNNLLFHYTEVDGILEPDDCVIVDYQAVKCKPPAADVMMLLCCNLHPKFREENMLSFLDYYYQKLKDCLETNDINVEDVIMKKDFLVSAEKQRKWGLVVCACLIPQFWVDDDLTTKIFCDTTQFNEVLSKDKGAFIKKMMKENNDYKEKVLEIFEEIVERYCI